jgi:hypothetical protein
VLLDSMICVTVPQKGCCSSHESIVSTSSLVTAPPSTLGGEMELRLGFLHGGDSLNISDVATRLCLCILNMCTFSTKVHSCGHYTKELTTPCNTAKTSKTACDSGSEDSKTTLTWCYKVGCDKKPGIRREGPGTLGPKSYSVSQVTC